MVDKVKIVLQMFREGKSVEEIFVATGVSKSVIRRWIEQRTGPVSAEDQSRIKHAPL